jgi:hypothetical protein
MMIEINPGQLDAIVHVWLTDTLWILETNSDSEYVHPDDVETYQDDIKAVKRLLEYLSEHPND